MQKFQAQKRVRRLVYSWQSILCVAIIIGFLTKATWGAYRKYEIAERNRADAQKEYEALRGRHDTLTREISHLKTQEGVEAQLRRNFQVARPGEDLVVVTDAPTTTVSTTTPPEKSFWRKWFSD